MPLQILTLRLDGITAGDYLRWCRDPEPPALDYALRSISLEADPLGDTITAILDRNQPLRTPPAAATAAGLPLSPGVKIDALLTSRTQGQLPPRPNRIRRTPLPLPWAVRAFMASSDGPPGQGPKVNSAPPPTTMTKQTDMVGAR